MSYEKYLPIGTVVLLKNANKKIMITGYLTSSTDEKNSNDEYYDYSGCFFPEGYIPEHQIYLFNHDQISKIYYLGLFDDEEERFHEYLKNA